MPPATPTVTTPTEGQTLQHHTTFFITETGAVAPVSHANAASAASCAAAPTPSSSSALQRTNPRPALVSYGDPWVTTPVYSPGVGASLASADETHMGGSAMTPAMAKLLRLDGVEPPWKARPGSASVGEHRPGAAGPGNRPSAAEQHRPGTAEARRPGTAERPRPGTAPCRNSGLVATASCSNMHANMRPGAGAELCIAGRGAGAGGAAYRRSGSSACGARNIRSAPPVKGGSRHSCALTPSSSTSMLIDLSNADHATQQQRHAGSSNPTPLITPASLAASASFAASVSLAASAPHLIGNAHAAGKSGGVAAAVAAGVSTGACTAQQMGLASQQQQRQQQHRGGGASSPAYHWASSASPAAAVGLAAYGSHEIYPGQLALPLNPPAKARGGGWRNTAKSPAPAVVRSRAVAQGPAAAQGPALSALKAPPPARSRGERALMAAEASAGVVVRDGSAVWLCGNSS